MLPNDSENNQEGQLEDLVFILAIAGRIDAQSRVFAKQLDLDRAIYYGYAAFDGVSSSYSMFKYFFDILIGKDSDHMHETMMTPGGIIVITLESLFLVGFSVLAALFDNDNDKEDEYKKWINTAWPYVRDVIKGLKNAYKGWRSTLIALSLLSGMELGYLVTPIGLVFGILSASNRFWLRDMVESRKIMMGKNGKLRNQIKELDSLNAQETAFYLTQIEVQSYYIRRLAFLTAGLNGFVDGLYLYVGVLGLATLTPPLLSILMVTCAIYIGASILTRLYEEYDYQLSLLRTQTKCKLELIAKEIEIAYKDLMSAERTDAIEALNSSTITSEYLERYIHFNDRKAQLREKICTSLVTFEEYRGELTRQSTRGYLSSALLGLKTGIVAYGSLTSTLFFFSTVLTPFGLSFSPTFLAVNIMLGLVFLAGFIAYYLVIDHLDRQEKKKQEEEKEMLQTNDIVNGFYGQSTSHNHLLILKQMMQENSTITGWCTNELFRSYLDESMEVSSSPKHFFPEWFEIVRCLFSGFIKGQKFIQFAGNPLQDRDEQGHYHDSRIMNILSFISAIVFGVTLALRALARGLGRLPLEQQSQVVQNELIAPNFYSESSSATGRISDSIEQQNQVSPNASDTETPLDSESMDIVSISSGEMIDTDYSELVRLGIFRHKSLPILPRVDKSFTRPRDSLQGSSTRSLDRIALFNITQDSMSDRYTF